MINFKVVRDYWTLGMRSTINESLEIKDFQGLYYQKGRVNSLFLFLFF